MNKWAKYGGMAFQFLACILIGYFVGDYLDAKYGNETKYLTALCSVVMLFVCIFLIIKDVIKKS